LSILLLIGAFYPKEGIKVYGHDFHFFTMGENTKEKESISEAMITINIDSLVQVAKQKKDSLELVSKILKQKLLDSILLSQKTIQYPNNDKSILFSFFEKLDNAKIKKVRIMHYGDSQIEADRITSRLRERLQKEFGGYGAGAFSVIPATRKLAIKTEYSSNWRRKTGFGPYIDTAIDHKNYGALFAFSKYLTDSVKNKGEIDIFKPTKAYKHGRYYQQLNIYYTNSDSTQLTVINEDSILFSDTLKITNKISQLSFNFNSTPSQLSLQFTGNNSPLLYGISTEGKTGVVVDNIPLRGASGTEFSKIDYNGLKNMHELLSPALFILEFGGNSIPYMKTKESCERYGNWFKKQIQKLQKINPEANFIIIGPGDMSTKDKTELITYPLLINVRDELRDAALETNSCFWDMYLNMGGENSIQEWAKEAPALAAKDYIHFTNLGARKIADMFISDLMEDYKSFKMNNSNE
jgi:hypothetical protein